MLRLPVTVRRRGFHGKIVPAKVVDVDNLVREKRRVLARKQAKRAGEQNRRIKHAGRGRIVTGCCISRLRERWTPGVPDNGTGCGVIFVPFSAWSCLTLIASELWPVGESSDTSEMTKP